MLHSPACSAADNADACHITYLTDAKANWSEPWRIKAADRTYALIHATVASLPAADLERRREACTPMLQRFHSA
jgi:hypothetical protein